jgi:hypothetical protein
MAAQTRRTRLEGLLFLHWTCPSIYLCGAEKEGDTGHNKRPLAFPRRNETTKSSPKTVSKHRQWNILCKAN